MDKKKDKSAKSDTQLRMESVIRESLEKKLRIKLKSGKIPLNGIESLQIDACNTSRNEYYEIYSRQGELKSGHRRKISHDILKLLLLKECLPSKPKIGFVYASENIDKFIKGDNWLSLVIKKFEINPVNIKLSKLHKQKIWKAEKRQAKNR